jgi:predicted HAD superfamily Cof-like phosphohydrolase
MHSERVNGEVVVERDAPEPRQDNTPHDSGIAAAVGAFHAAFGLPRNDAPTADVPADLAALRVRLLAEEVDEFATATADCDLVSIADALADIVYVAYGSAVTYGIDLDAVLTEVHRSNMSKLDASGRPLLREDGKVMKSSRYTPPNVANVLNEQSQVPWQ